MTSAIDGTGKLWIQSLIVVPPVRPRISYFGSNCHKSVG
jgi:hypothetical protein